MKTNSKLKQLLEKGEFVVTAEIGLPTSINKDILKKKAELVKGKVAAVIVRDGRNADVHLSNLAAAILLMQQDIEPIMEISCRDRNRIAIQSDVLGAASLGIHNMLCSSGDHQKLGSFPESKHCYDLDSTQEIIMLKQMRDEKKLSNGQELDVAPPLVIGVEENPFSDPLELRIILAALRMRNQGLKQAPDEKLFGFDSWHFYISNYWHEADFGLSQRLPWVAKVNELLLAGKSFQLEELLLSIVWEHYQRQSLGHYFDFEAVIIYVLRWDMISRWSGNDKTLALTRFNHLLDSGLQQIDL